MIPRFLNPGSRYNIQLWGRRTSASSAIIDYSLVSIRDGEDASKIDVPPPDADTILVTSPDDLDFAGELNP